jgi:hypothetical protein
METSPREAPCGSADRKLSGIVTLSGLRDQRQTTLSSRGYLTINKPAHQSIIAHLSDTMPNLAAT